MSITGTSVYAGVFEALDQVVSRQRCLPGSEARVQSALCHFRGSRSDPDAVRQLESMSVSLHELAAADFHRRDAMRREAVERLRVLADQWMARLPIH